MKTKEMMKDLIETNALEQEKIACELLSDAIDPPNPEEIVEAFKHLLAAWMFRRMKDPLADVLMIVNKEDE